MTTPGKSPFDTVCRLSDFQSDTFRFFRAWVSAPLTVASVLPSGKALARAMTSSVSRADSPVLELGPGTGVFTRSLLSSGIAESDLTLVEYGEDFALALRARFPASRVLRMDATKLDLLQIARPFGAVVSGLPLLSMTHSQIAAVLSGAFSKMRADGQFLQFTYGFRCPVPQPLLDQFGLEAVHHGRALLNVPPANVYCITRRKAFESGSPARSTKSR